MYITSHSKDVTDRKVTGLPVQVIDLILIELTNWRWTWRSMLLTATITPLLSILGLGVFARDAGPGALAYVLTGNVVVSLMFGNMGNVESHVTFMRSQGIFDYFASLPISRYALVIAVVFAFLLLSLPSLVLTILLGSLLLGVPVHVHPLVLVVVPLCALALSGLGALIGVTVREPSQGSAWNLLLTMVMAGLGPVIVPPDRLPAILRVLGYLSPATYAASAFRQTLLGPVTIRLALDLGVLALLTLLFLWLVTRSIDWRQR